MNQRNLGSPSRNFALPRAFNWLMKRMLTAADFRSVTNDLAELYEFRLQRDGAPAARRWLRRQLLAYPYYLLLNRRGHPRQESLKPVDPDYPEEPMKNLLHDFRYSLRGLSRAPLLSATIVITVGLGIGAATALFSVVNSVLLQPLPYPDASQIFRVYTDSPPNRWPLSVVDYQALQAQQKGFSALAGYGNTLITFTDGDQAERLAGKQVTWAYFDLLGIPPLHGRLFLESDDQPGAEPTAVVSYDFWSRTLKGDLAVLDQNIQLDGSPYRLIGVLPPRTGPLDDQKDVFVAAQWQTPTRKGPFFIIALGRLRSGVTRPIVEAELRAINQRIFPIWQASYQDSQASWGVAGLKDQLVGDVRTMLLVVLGAVGFLLLIAVTNATNLLVARATRRQRELALRSVLGASRSRLLQYLLTESALLATTAAALGWLVARGSVELITTVGSRYLPRTSEIALGGSSFLFWILVTAGSLLMFALIPALQAFRAKVESVLASGGRASTTSPSVRRFRWALVASQFAVAVPLLVGALLLTASLLRLQKVDPGFEHRNLLTLALSLPEAGYPERRQVLAFWERLVTEIGGLPGVEGVALADDRPPRVNMINNFDLEDYPTPAGQSQPSSPWVAVNPEYFQVLQIPLIQGRLLRSSDHADAPPVAVVDQTWAKRFFPNESPIGHRFYSGGATTGPRTTIVGVVGDVKHEGLENPHQGTVYWPLLDGTFRSRFLLVRTVEGAPSLVPALRSAIQRLDPGLPLTNIATAGEVLADSIRTPSYLTILVGGFALAALLLTVVGIYGMMAYFVEEHTRDIGIRLALGGLPSTILAMVLGRGLKLAGAGILIGVLGAVALSRTLSTLLFEVDAGNPFIFATVTLLMLGAALLASAYPARKAARIDPATVLREE